MNAILTLLTLSAVAQAVPTFNKDIAPILHANCTSCHRPGEVGPFELITYRDASKRARQIADVAEERVMPPWKPDAGHETFLNARVLKQSDIALLREWVKAGKPEGAEADRKPPPAFPEGWHCGEPDMVLKVTKPFRVPAEGADIYVHFVLPLSLPKDRYVRGVQIRPSDRRVAHHGVIMLDGSGKARALAAKNGGDHYPNFGGPGFIPRGFLPGYAPGMTTRVGPKNDAEVSITVGKGSDVVLQMHYHPIGKETFDQPQIGLYFTDTPPKRGPNVVLMANNEVDLPAGAEKVVNKDVFKLPVDFEVRDIWGHMHMLGKTLAVTAFLPDGSSRGLLSIKDWDFNWQDTYVYRNPFVLPKGTTIRAEWSWDNSAGNPRNPNKPPLRVTLGEGSKDEMTGLIIGGVTRQPGWDEGIMWMHVLGHYFDVEAKAKQAVEARAKASK